MQFSCQQSPYGTIPGDILFYDAFIGALTHFLRLFPVLVEQVHFLCQRLRRRIYQETIDPIRNKFLCPAGIRAGQDWFPRIKTLICHKTARILQIWYIEDA